MTAADTEAQSPGIFRKLYLGWLEIAARFGEVQTLIVVSIVYALVIGPMAVAIAVGRGDLLHKRNLFADGSVWNDADSTPDPDVERAKRLF